MYGATTEFTTEMNSVVAPYMLNPKEGNLKGKAAFPAGAFTVLLLVWNGGVVAQ
jgi:SP family general alpha glucoside:H+ symporter-like MFS transporter